MLRGFRKGSRVLLNPLALGAAARPGGLVRAAPLCQWTVKRRATAPRRWERGQPQSQPQQQRAFLFTWLRHTFQLRQLREWWDFELDDFLHVGLLWPAGLLPVASTMPLARVARPDLGGLAASPRWQGAQGAVETVHAAAQSGSGEPSRLVELKPAIHRNLYVELERLTQAATPLAVRCQPSSPR